MNFPFNCFALGQDCLKMLKYSYPHLMMRNYLVMLRFRGLGFKQVWLKIEYNFQVKIQFFAPNKLSLPPSLSHFFHISLKNLAFFLSLHRGSLHASQHKPYWQNSTSPSGCVFCFGSALVRSPDFSSVSSTLARRLALCMSAQPISLRLNAPSTRCNLFVSLL